MCLMGEGCMNRKELDFAVFCIESVAERLGLNGYEVYLKLNDDSDILDGYIIENYEVLHTQGKEYIVEDIVGVMRGEGLVE